MNKFVYIAFAFFFIGIIPLEADIYTIDLKGTWKLTFSDKQIYSKIEYVDDRWRNVKMPDNLTLKGVKPGRWFWLRKRFNIDKLPHGKNLALVIGPVYNSDIVYYNGVMIGKTLSNLKRPDNYGRPRIYLIPRSILKTGKNVIAIRMRGAFPSEIGINGRPLIIQDLLHAEWELMKSYLFDLITIAIFLVSGLFFIILFFRIKLIEYLWFGIFATVFALLLFGRNEFRFVFGNWFLFFKLIEQLAYTITPTIVLFFFRELFKIKFHRLVFIYPIVNGLTSIAMIITMNPILWAKIISIWFYINIPFFVYYVYIAFIRAIRDKEIEAMLVSSGLVIMLFAIGHFFAVSRGFIAPPSYLNIGALFFILCIALALIYRMIKLQLEVEDRQNRLNEVNELRDRVFKYLKTLVHKPADNIIRLSLSLANEELDPDIRFATIQELNLVVDEIQTDLDDILELSRLEVITEPEYIEPVNFNDFITAVIPEGELTCYIKVNPDIVLKTSLELVNSIVIRLIDFPGFKQFKHIDLIITSDLKQNIHFRFLLYHNEFRSTRKLYNLLTSINPEQGSLWIKWGIVREIVRILSGDLNINILNQKFLRIDIKLAAELPVEVRRISRDSGNVQIKYNPTLTGGSEVLTAEATAVASAAIAARSTDIKPTPFSKDMSVSEFIQAVSSRIRRQ